MTGESNMEEKSKTHRFKERIAHLLALDWHDVVLGMARMLEEDAGREFLTELYFSGYSTRETGYGKQSYSPDPDLPLPTKGDDGQANLQKAILRAMAVEPDVANLPFLRERVEEMEDDHLWKPELQDEVPRWSSACHGELVLYALASIGTEEAVEMAARNVDRLRRDDRYPLESNPPEGTIDALLRASHRHGSDHLRLFLDSLDQRLIPTALDILPKYDRMLTAELGLDSELTFPDDRLAPFVDAIVIEESDGPYSQGGDPSPELRSDIVDKFGRKRVVEAIEGILERTLDVLEDAQDDDDVLTEGAAAVRRLLDAYTDEVGKRAVPYLIRCSALHSWEEARRERYEAKNVTRSGGPPSRIDYGEPPSISDYRGLAIKAEELLVGLGKSALDHLNAKASSENEAIASAAGRAIGKITNPDHDEA